MQINAAVRLLLHGAGWIETGARAMMTTAQALASAPPLVAVIDDDAAVCSSLKFSLELEGFRVRTFAGGAEALRAVDIGACQCFVVDQKMLGMSGLELIDKLRERDIAAPAILIISQPSAALSAWAVNARVPIIEKPLFGNALLDRINEFCGRSTQS
jgi:two-component system, LuxR family, response regulator FixJ